MIEVDLLAKYPDLIDKCRAWDCGFAEAIAKLEQEKHEASLLRFIS